MKKDRDKIYDLGIFNDQTEDSNQNIFLRENRIIQLPHNCLAKIEYSVRIL